MRSIIAILALGLASFVAADLVIDSDCLAALDGPPTDANQCLIEVSPENVKRSLEARKPCLIPDAAKNCINVISLCNKEAYYSYLWANCRKTCALC